jgi:CheY-like chemotaxis protein
MNVSNAYWLMTKSIFCKRFNETCEGVMSLVTASGGQAAIDMLQKNEPFAVVVSDMQMPEVDGMQVLSAARKLAPDTVRNHVDRKRRSEHCGGGSQFRRSVSLSK